MPASGSRMTEPMAPGGGTAEAVVGGAQVVEVGTTVVDVPTLPAWITGAAEQAVRPDVTMRSAQRGMRRRTIPHGGRTTDRSGGGCGLRPRRPPGPEFLNPGVVTLSCRDEYDR